MITKIKKTPIKMSVVIATFLFACGGGSGNPPTLTIIEAEHTTSEATAAIISERSEAKNAAKCNIAVSENSENTTGADDRPRNTKWADEYGNPRYGYFDVYGRQHTQNFEIIHEKPLFNGKDYIEELQNFVSENNKFKEIIEKYNIQNATYAIEIMINTDGSVDAKIREETTHQVLGEELLRLINSMQEHGKITSGKNDGELVNTHIPWYGKFMR